MKTKILATLLALTLISLFTSNAFSQKRFIAALNSYQVVPSTAMTSVGTCELRFYESVGLLGGKCRFAGMESGIMDGHVHIADPMDSDNPRNKILDLPVPKGSTQGEFNILMPLGEQVRPLLLEKRLNIDLHSNALTEGEIRGQIKALTIDYDADGDARADALVARSTDWNTTTLYALRSIDNLWTTGDFSVPIWQDRVEPMLADFDGDGIADLTAIHYSTDNGSLIFYYLQSTTFEMKAVQWGNYEKFNDQPVLGYFDSDSKIDIAVFRPAEGTWYVLKSTTNEPLIVRWGKDGDKACTGDYDKDSVTDFCIVRENGDQLDWYILRSFNHQMMVYTWGRPGDIINSQGPMDVDGDMIDDPVIARKEDGHWNFYGLRSSDQYWDIVRWGLDTDRIRVGDYDGDGISDYAALRPQGDQVDDQLVWYVRSSRTGKAQIFNWGLPTDK